MGNLRIIGGDQKGRRLFSLRDSDLRPTSGRVREALFDILGEAVIGARFLDLFAGTGAVGIEALSRGASTCLFLEENRAAVAILHRNLDLCGFASRSRVIPGSLPGTLARLAAGGSFDLVFADPPYGDPAAEQTLEALGEAGIAAAGSKIILEHRKSRTPPGRLGRLLLRRSVRYGDTLLSFFEVAAGPQPGEKGRV